MLSNTLGELQARFQGLVQDLPSDTAHRRVYEVSGGSGTVFELTPTNSAAAPFSVYASGSELYTFSLGARSFWEFPYERRYRHDEKSAAAEIEEMSKAVIAGCCEEIFGHISVTGRIYVGDYSYKTTTIPVFSLRRRTCRYAPYMPTV